MRNRRAIQTELDVNNAQKTACAGHAGAVRFASNWGLGRKIEAYQAGQKVPSAIDRHRGLNRLHQSELAWMYAVSKCAPQEALRNLDQAYGHFFRWVKEKRGGKNIQVGFPRIKSKQHGLGSLRLTGASPIFENAIQLPHLGMLRLKEPGYLPTAGGHLLSATVSERAGRWLVSAPVEKEIPDPEPAEKGAVGVDLGMLRMATVSDGNGVDTPRAVKQALNPIKRVPPRVSHRPMGRAATGQGA